MLVGKRGSSFPHMDHPASCTVACCRNCKKPVDPIKKGVRLMKKTHPQEWQCEVCNGKVASLTNLFGSWPIAAYHKLSDIEKTSFWADSEKDKIGLQNAVEEKIVLKQVKQLVDDNVGKFLPLDVWISKGWPKEFVEKCPCEEHKQGGLKTSGGDPLDWHEVDTGARTERDE